jgi:hypothetical protein
MHPLREKFNRLPLRVHSLLAGVPLRTLQRVELPGGSAGMTLPEINAVLGFSRAEGPEVGPITRALFWLRNWIGRLLGWEDEEAQLVHADLHGADHADAEVDHLPFDDERRQAALGAGVSQRQWRSKHR